MTRIARLLLLAASALTLSGAAQAACTLTPATTLAQLPFAGTVSNSNVDGFMFDNEGYTVQPGEPNTNLLNSVESSLRILSLDALTGAFTGTVYGPYAANSTLTKAVTGKIVQTNGANFSINYSYTVAGKVRGSYYVLQFAGAIRSLVMPATATDSCYTAEHIAGTYTSTAHFLSLNGATTSVFGPSPFSGFEFNLTIPK